MKILKYEIEGENILLLGFGDIHWGHLNCDKLMVHTIIKFIEDHNCYWIGMGDYGDAIIPSDPRFDYRSIDPQYKTPQEQYDCIEELFRPIASKCLGLLDGNHDILHWKQHAHNYVKALAKNLGVPYLGTSAYIRLIFKNYEGVYYNIYCHHGWTGARTKGAKISRIFDLEGIYPMLDLYMMGHTHDLGLVDEKPNLYVDNELEIRDRLARFVYTGGFLRGYVKDSTSYVEAGTYRPTTLGMPAIILTPKRGKATISFDFQIKHIR